MLLPLPVELSRRHETLMIQQGVAVHHRPRYTRWLRYSWDFCHKYGYDPNDRQSFPLFDEKLCAKKQSAFQRRQARHAISLYYASLPQDFPGGQELRGRIQVQASKNHLAGATVSSDSAERRVVPCRRLNVR